MYVYNPDHRFCLPLYYLALALHCKIMMNDVNYAHTQLIKFNFLNIIWWCRWVIVVEACNIHYIIIPTSYLMRGCVLLFKFVPSRRKMFCNVTQFKFFFSLSNRIFFKSCDFKENSVFISEEWSNLWLFFSFIFLSLNCF